MITNQRQRIVRISLSVFSIVFVVASLCGTLAEAKKRRSTASGTFKISQVTTSPTPFEVGNGSLTISTIVKIPRNLQGLYILEISALVTSPTQRSMRFLTQRVPVGSKAAAQLGPKISVVLVWDGKDQSHTLVDPGVYRYEVRAKLMAEKGAGIATRMVSRRSRGAVEVIKYHAPQPPVILEDLQNNSEISSDDSSASDDESSQEEAVEPVVDEVEMLPDESTSHPPLEPGEPGVEIIEEEEMLVIPQEG